MVSPIIKMVTAIESDKKELEYISSQNIIKTKYWELPEGSLAGWHPYTAYIPIELFYGPALKGYGRGFTLQKDLMGGVNGPRGATKTLFMTYLLAKKMVSGKPVWTNYPISFYVIEKDDSLTYYESMPLDLDKFYAFSEEIRNGAVGIDELQYYVEARTSMREQNRMASYQIMQIRKTALSFVYTVQDQAWVDKRFGWSNDFNIELSDLAKMPHRHDVARVPKAVLDADGFIKEGAYSMGYFQDISGVNTGKPYHKVPIENGPFRFSGWHFWNTYPTHFIVDVYEAVHSYKKDNDKQEADEKLYVALTQAIEWFLDKGIKKVGAADLWDKIGELGNMEVPTRKAGQMLAQLDIPKKQKSGGKYVYDLSVVENRD